MGKQAPPEDLQTLIDIARATTRELREAIKDAHQARRELTEAVAGARREIGEYAGGAVGEIVHKVLERQIKDAAEMFGRVAHAAYQRVGSECNRLLEMYTKGEEGGVSLHEAAMARQTLRRFAREGGEQVGSAKVTYAPRSTGRPVP